MMNLKNKIGTIFEKKDVKTYEVIEGDFTTQKVVNVRNGETIIGGIFENQVDEECFLAYGSEDLSVTLAPAGGLATHFNQYEPELQINLPTENVVDGDYTRRIVGAAQLKLDEKPLPLDPDNVAIKSGDRLEVKNPKTGLDKSSATNNTAVALETVGAKTGGYILVSIEGPIRVKA